MATPADAAMAAEEQRARRARVRAHAVKQQRERRVHGERDRHLLRAALREVREGQVAAGHDGPGHRREHRPGPEVAQEPERHEREQAEHERDHRRPDVERVDARDGAAEQRPDVAAHRIAAREDRRHEVVGRRAVVHRPRAVVAQQLDHREMDRGIVVEDVAHDARAAAAHERGHAHGVGTERRRPRGEQAAPVVAPAPVGPLGAPPDDAAGERGERADGDVRQAGHAQLRQERHERDAGEEAGGQRERAEPESRQPGQPGAEPGCREGDQERSEDPREAERRRRLEIHDGGHLSEWSGPPRDREPP